MAEPNRTPGKAEGTVEAAAGSQGKPVQNSSGGNPAKEPNRTPGKAEGTVEDVNQSLKEQEKRQG